MARLFDVRPTVVAHDLHPEYLSTKHAIDLADADPELRLVGVQHHHAHVAACLADNGVTGPVIGVALDGLGYGEDGTLWGGEVLVADLAASRTGRPPRRRAHARRGRGDPRAVAHGARAPRRGRPRRRGLGRWRGATPTAGTPCCSWRARAPTRPTTSSMGRLFDAVAALCGLHDTVTFEGQAAIALEQVADLGRDR